MNPFEHFYRHEQIFILLDKLHVKSWHWISLSVVVAGADLLSGNTIQFPILYVLSIGLASWFDKRNHALFLAICLPCSWLFFRLLWDVPWFAVDTLMNFVIRLIVFVSLAYLISFAWELHVLRGFLYICSHGHCIKEDNGTWVPLEKDILNHSEAMFSHGICPDGVPNFNKHSHP
jgi:hypothetical protein